MDYVSNKQPQIDEMLRFLEISSIEDLFTAIPEKLKMLPPSSDDGLSEMEGMLRMELLAQKNTYGQFDNYLGAGAYEHHIPALVNAICSKSEFLTSYTPYQAEASQGMLQIIFEFQSAICALTGMDVSNASVYDGASACAEAALMALRISPDKYKILMAETLHPSYQQVVKQYLSSHKVQIVPIPFKSDGTLDQEGCISLVDEQTAAVIIQNPNFFGVVEDLKLFISKVKRQGALVILCANPLAYGLFSSAGESGVDIAVGDCQPLGLPMQFGGPYVGYMACRQELVRQMPGRIVGETVDTQGNRGFVLTLQAREQHIRREKATSNICTNQALAALASLIAMLWYGKKGLYRLALTNFQRAAYLRTQLSKIPHIYVSDVPAFNEFVIHFKQPLEPILKKFRDAHIEPGLPLSRFYPQLSQGLLVSVTETKSKSQIDKYIQVAANL
jgi:glycine dehydrogenase subunit 1